MKSEKIGKEARIHPSVKIDCEYFEVGDFCTINEGVTIKCRKFIAGDWLYMDKGVEVGRGGCNTPNSTVTIGDRVGIFDNAMINPNYPVSIGSDTGIGSEVMIWTHGAWLDIMEGYPSQFGPVMIESNVWLPARSIVLPNVHIGYGSVIGIGSIVNRNIPACCFAAGNPCKVIKEGAYPKSGTTEQLIRTVISIVGDWYTLLTDKIDTSDIRWTINTRAVLTLFSHTDQTKFYMNDPRKIRGDINDVSEDLRDYLRRRGIKIYTDRHFKSI